MKTTRSIRFDPKILALAESKGLDLNELCREAVNKAVKEQTCPTCGQYIKPKADK